MDTYLIRVSLMSHEGGVRRHEMHELTVQVSPKQTVRAAENKAKRLAQKTHPWATWADARILKWPWGF